MDVVTNKVWGKGWEGWDGLDNTSKEAAALGACHWETSEGGDGETFFTVACKYCGVKGMVPLRSSQSEESEEPPSKRLRAGPGLTVVTGAKNEVKLPPFDPVDAHRYFCCVISEDGKNGWRLSATNTNVKKT